MALSPLSSPLKKTFSRTWPQAIQTPYSLDLTLYPYPYSPSRSLLESLLLPPSRLQNRLSSSRSSAVRSPYGASFLSNFRGVLS